MANKTNIIEAIKFSQVELPQPKEDTRKEWVAFGKKNDFPIYLQELMKRSALHNAILVSKTESIVGNGFTYEGEDSENTIDEKTEAWLNAPNPSETSEELLRKVAFDFQLYGGFYLSCYGQEIKILLQKHIIMILTKSEVEKRIVKELLRNIIILRIGANIIQRLK